MKKMLLVCVLVSFFIVSFVFSQSVEEPLSVKGEASFEYLSKDNAKRIVSIPREWGKLKAVTTHGGMDVLYFEAEDGSIYVVQGYPVDEKNYFIKEFSGAIKIQRK